MARAGEIRGVNVRSAAQHGFGLYEVFGWITHSSVEEASASSSGTYSAVKVSAATNGSRVEDLDLIVTGCKYAVDSNSTIRIGGIDTHGTPVTSLYNVASSTIWSRAFFSSFSLGGTLATGPGTFRLPFAYSARVVSVRATVGTAPTGASVIVDVHKNGTTIFTTQANRPTIAVSTNMSQVALPDVVNIVAGDYLTVDVDQVGSTFAGADLTVTVQMENDG